MVNQIESIFAKARAPQSAKSCHNDQKSRKIASTGACLKQGALIQKKKSVRRNSGSAADPFAKGSGSKSGSLDFTEEGWKIYTAEELSIGKGGDTELCPFDCKCCF